VAIVERALGARLVDREHGAAERPLVLEPAKPDQPGGGLLGASDQAVEQLAAELVGGDLQIRAIVHRHPRIALERRAHVLGVRRQGLAAPAPDFHAVVVHERGGHVVLDGQRVGRAQRWDRAPVAQRQQQVGGLGGDVQARRDPDSLERALGPEPLADLREHGHLLAGPREPLLARGGQR